MNLDRLNQIDEYTWEITPIGKMNVPAIIYASRELIKNMDDKVYEQLCNVCALPGIVERAYAMPDAHWGYGFPIGGVAAFDPDNNGVVSAGGVGFDISCGVRLLHTGLKIEDIRSQIPMIADLLYKKIPSGVGSQSRIKLSTKELNEMLMGGAQWAIKRGYGEAHDLDFIEEHGCIHGAMPEHISEKAKERQRPEMGTLGSGNHYLELQEVKKIDNVEAATAMGLYLGDVVISIHCGSRGLGHQIGTDYLRSMLVESKKYGIQLSDRELACAPIRSELGQQYLGAMRGGINCALANRQILTHFAREAFVEMFSNSNLRLVYDVSHNTCKEEEHVISGVKKNLFVHRKGATRAFGPDHPELPIEYKKIGQPVFIGGSMGVGSYVLAGTKKSESLSFSSACHGAGRAMSRTEASRLWTGPQVIHDLQSQGIFIRSGTFRGVAEEAPLAYKDLNEVVDSAENAGIALKVAHLAPHACIKG